MLFINICINDDAMTSGLALPTYNYDKIIINIIIKPHPLLSCLVCVNQFVGIIFKKKTRIL